MLTKLKQRITIQTLTTTSAGGGCYEETWTDSYNRWASVQINNAKESYAYNKNEQINYYKIIMRNETFTNKQRIKYNDLILIIESIQDSIQLGKMMQIIARSELL